MTYNGTSDGQTYNTTASYITVYASSTTYKINMTYIGNNQNLTMPIWILKNGTVLAIDESGQNITGLIGNQLIMSYFAGFAIESEVAAQLSSYTASAYFHSAGTTSVTIGPSTFTVTNYTANSLPETFTPCGGATISLSTYSLSVGTPTGANAPIVTSLQFAGSETSGGQTSSISYVIKLTSITVR
jgi:hypothetical protein